MKIIKLISVSLFFVLISQTFAKSEDFSSIKPIFCSVNQVNECVAWEGCNSINPYIANIPNFLTVDLASKTISGGTTADDGRRTSIERIEIIDELITLTGAEPESKNHEDKFGWLMTITKDTGKMIISANSNSSAIVIFGNCIHGK